ncbi:hypothetical protein [Carbonactinospora thermoautotrophica]|uniref:hypothetical protein n=1 Tax=Carbonactinospora thermoautotrophica TaxID=1469144 RepID=UPI0022706B4A|nr:hypothetical protein [Carbonactinospora thermoautotrophica]
MTYDVVALLPSLPDVRDTLEAVIAVGGRDFRFASAGNDAVLCLYDRDGWPVLAVENPFLVQVPGEVERLLGPEVAADAPTPTWWVEIRAPSARIGAPELARAFAAALVERVGGVVWQPPVTPDPNGEASPRTQAGASATSG